MKINITKKNVITAIIGFLAGIIITTSVFLIISGFTHRQHRLAAPPSFSQSQNYVRQGTNGENSQKIPESNSNQNGQYKKDRSDSDKEGNSKSLRPEAGRNTAENGNNP